MTKTLTIAQFINEVADGKFFSVTFVKKTDGSVREMLARRGVSKGVKGVLPEGQRKAEDAANNVLTVFDVQAEEKVGEKGAFRRINLENLISVKLHGESYTFNHESGLLVA